MLAIAALTLLATQPLMRLVVTRSHDGSLHLLRLIELDQSLRQGQLYPRWSPDMAYGYGYPLFNFYAPFSFYLAEALHLLGLSFVAAWNGTMFLCLLAAGLFAYLLARDWMPEHGAVVAASAYLLAPYTIYDIYFRGNLAESTALPLLPLVLWAFGRLVRSRQARYLALAAISLALLLLTHQVMTLLFLPVLAIYVLLLWWREGHVPWHLLIVLTAGLLALGLSAFFWMPAFLEKETVQIEQAFTPGGMNFRYNFITPGELFSPPVPAPLGLMNPSPPRSLSLAALALGLLGLLPLALRLGSRFWRRFKVAFPIFARDVSAEVRRAWHLFATGQASAPLPPPPAGPSPPQTFNLPTLQPSMPPLLPSVFRHERRQILLLAAVLALGFMTLSPSLLLWEYIPLFHFAQFPWRFLGPASLMAALAAGNSLSLLFSRLPAGGRRRWLILGGTTVAVTALFAFSLGWLYPLDRGQPETTIAAIPRFERATGIIGTTSAGEYLPRYVEEMPDPEVMAVMYETGSPIIRLDPTLLPEGATVELAEYGLTSARLLIHSPEPFRAVYRNFYFPGWRVAINGQNVPIIVTAPQGLISFQVPAGQAAVEVWFGTTPLRLGSTLLSGAVALMVLWLAWQGRHEGGFAPASALVAARWWQWLILVGLAGGLLWVKIAAVDPGGTWFRPIPFDGQTLQKIDVPLDVNFGGELTLLGYNLPRQEVAADQALFLELFWAARDRPSAGYSFSARLVDDRGIEWSPKGTRRPGGFQSFPTTQGWQTDEYARDAHFIDILPGTPPGNYTLRITAFERETLAGLDVLNDQGAPVGQSTAVATIAITRPDRPPTPEDLDMTYRLDAPLGDLTLLGLSLGRLKAAPGDPVLLTTFWRAGQPPQGIYTVYADLVDDQGQSVATMAFLPGAPQHTTHRWLPGEVVRDQQVWVVPYDVASGRYAIRFRVQDKEEKPLGEAWLKEQKLEIIAPERQMDVPAMDHQTGANFGDRTTLLGYDLSPASPQAGDVIRLTLYWRAKQEMRESYKIFVHLLDSEDLVRAQHDAVPANWTRPTTGWLPGELLTDVHELALDPEMPPGEYQLEVGLYDEQSGDRLPLLDGAGRVVDERVMLDAVQIENPD